jgi:hypothetical protein
MIESFHNSFDKSISLVVVVFSRRGPTVLLSVKIQQAKVSSSSHQEFDRDRVET